MKQFAVLTFTFSCFLISSFSSIHGQEADWANEPSVQRYSTAQGLFSNYILSSFQDHEGYLWIGSVGGLYRFDGYSFYKFPEEPNNPHSLHAQSIPYIYEDAQLNLWIASANNGLKLLDRETGQFTHFLPDPKNPKAIASSGVLRMLEDEQGNFWVGTNKGLNLMDREKGTFTLFPYQFPHGEKTPPLNVLNLELVKDGTIFVGTLNLGLFAFDPSAKKFTSIRLPFQDEKGKSKVPVRVQCIFEDEQGIIWVGTTTGLYLVNRYTGMIKTFGDQSDGAGSSMGNSIKDFKVDAEGNLWVATQSGLNRYLPESNSFVNYFKGADDPNGFVNDLIDHLMVDKQGDIWIGTGGGGINRLRPDEGVFKLFDNHHEFPSGGNLNLLSDFKLDDQGQLWIIDNNSQLAKFNPWKNDLTTYKLPLPNTEHSFTKAISSFILDYQGVAWIGTKALGLFKYNPENGLLTDFSSKFPAEWNLKNIGITGLYEDRQHQIWISLFNKGLVRYQPATDQFTRFLPNKEDSTSITKKFPTQVLEDLQGNIWVVLNSHGIDLFNPETQTFQHFSHDAKNPHSISSMQVHCVFEDSSGRIWVGTTKGLNLYQPNSNDFLRIKTVKGLSLGAIETIVEDEEQLLWIGSDRGMFRFDPQTQNIHMYDHTNGLAYQNYDRNSGVRHPKTGQLFFGTSGGLLTFHPKSFVDDPLVPKAVFSQATFYMADEQGHPREEIWIGNKEKIDLPYGVNIMEFELSLLNFHQVAKNKFAYQLISKSQWSTSSTSTPWFELGTENKLRFTNLPIGHHVLKIKGASANGIWSEEITTLALNIAAPWWRSRLAFMSYGLGLLGLLFFAQKMRTNRSNLLQQAEIAEARAEEEQRYSTKIAMQAMRLEDSIGRLQQKNKEIMVAQNQLVQQEKLASLGQLTAGIAHEIKNPLNFVNNFAEGSLDIMDELNIELEKHAPFMSIAQMSLVQNLIQELRQNSIDIRENGLRADQIIHSMMDHARDSQNEKEVININKLITNNINLTYHGYRAVDPAFNVEFIKQLDPMIGEQIVYPQALGRVLINLLNNACYAVAKKQKTATDDYNPTISISSELKEDTFEISIRDNGIGIPNKVKDKIFEPFFSTKETGRGNTGLGLSISYDIVVKQHGGDLSVQTEHGKFTEFLLALPVAHRNESTGRFPASNL